MATNKRIKNLEFRPAVYLTIAPKNPAWSIDYWQPNRYYGHENDYEVSKINPDCYIGEGCRIHKSCFENPESCFTLGSFEYDEHEEIYEFHFCGDRPLSLSEEERKNFWKLIEYGYNELNNCE